MLFAIRRRWLIITSSSLLYVSMLISLYTYTVVVTNMQNSNIYPSAILYLVDIRSIVCFLCVAKLHLFVVYIILNIYKYCEKVGVSYIIFALFEVLCGIIMLSFTKYMQKTKYH